MAIELDYESPQRRRWPWRGIVVAAVILCGALVAKLFAPGIRVAVLRSYWAGKCLAFQAPEDTVLYCDKVKSPDYERPLFSGYAVVFRPECAQQLAKVEQEDEARRGIAIPGLASTNFAIARWGDPTAFLHERVSPSGHHRLVHAELVDQNALIPEWSFFFTVLDPPSLLHSGRTITPAVILERSGAFKPARVYYGKADPNDPSHMTFRIEGPLSFGGEQIDKPKQGVIHAWLQDDDKVKVEVRWLPQK